MRHERNPAPAGPTTHEETLRRALAAYAERIEPRPDALSEIRRRIHARGTAAARGRARPSAGRSRE